MAKKNKVDLFLDSGAFSAWTQGVDIDIQDYIKFIKEHEDVINVYANLDVIGIGAKAKPGKKSADLTLQNHKIMQDAGLNPIGVFHIGEPISYLEWYVNNVDYVALGVAGNSGTKLIPWIDSCFEDVICDGKGFPKVKTHGFAVTSLKLMLRYPWYSVDSTSWVVTGRLGSIYVPRYRQGKWIYDENSWKIAVSSTSPRTSDAGKHLFTMKPKEKELILSYIHEKGFKVGKSEFKKVDADYKPDDGAGERWAEKKKKGQKKRLLEIIKEEGISNRYQLRDKMNIIYFQDLEKSMPEYPWAFKRKRKNRGLGI